MMRGRRDYKAEEERGTYGSPELSGIVCTVSLRIDSSVILDAASQS